MLKKRLIPCLLLQNGQLVKSTRFNDFQIIGNPKVAVQFFNAWAVDEIIFLDISETKEYTSLLRSDYNYKTLDNIIEILKDIAKICFVPLTVGGGIKTLDQMNDIFRNGADKVSLNTEAVRRPSFISEAANKFGSQAVVISIDVKKHKGKYEVFINHGREPTGLKPVDWAKKVESLGAGEIFLTSIDRDGLLNGYDLDLVKIVVEAVHVPVISCGGVGKWQDLVDGVNIGGASAVSAANIFHFTEQSTRNAKKYMAEAGIDVRI